MIFDTGEKRVVKNDFLKMCEEGWEDEYMSVGDVLM